MRYWHKLFQLLCALCVCRSVELVHETIALVHSGGSGGHPVTSDDGGPEGPEGHVDTADAHAPDVESPAENPGS